jgi:hypothetical protein
MLKPKLLKELAKNNFSINDIKDSFVPLIA